MRPKDILALAETLHRLAVNGAVPAGGDAEKWLISLGAGQPAEAGNWLYTDRRWIRSVANAKDDLDVIRRTAIRDPLYRFHLDAMVAEVIDLIAQGARWQKAEELLFGPLLSFTPRLVQLLELGHAEIEPEVHAIDWAKVRNIEGSDRETFEQWDQVLWGDAPGGAAAMFPLLLELYIPLRHIGVTVHSSLHGLSGPAIEVLASVVHCAQLGECLARSIVDTDVAELYNLGLPIRKWAPDITSPDRRDKIGLVSAVRLLLDHGTLTQFEGVSAIPANKVEMQDSLAETFDDARSRAQRSGFWDCSTHSIQRLAFTGLTVGSTWPATPDVAPQGVQIPGLNSFKGLGLSPKRSPEVDSALQTLADHLMFGVLLQLLLLEALDRELGQETLTLSLSRSPQDGSTPPDVQVFYRPANPYRTTEQHFIEGDTGGTSTYELGEFTTVLDQLAKGMQIELAGFSYASLPSRLWTGALFMLEQVGIVTIDPADSRCCLTLEALDRMHTGDLMTNVIRNGHRTREQLRATLTDLWTTIEEKCKQGRFENVS